MASAAEFFRIRPDAHEWCVATDDPGSPTSVTARVGPGVANQDVGQGGTCGLSPKARQNPRHRGLEHPGDLGHDLGRPVSGVERGAFYCFDDYRFDSVVGD